MAEELSREEEAVEWAVTDFIAKMNAMADSLRRMADVIDGRASHGDRIKADPAYEAAQVAHELAWGVANLNLEMLLTSAGRIYQYKTARDRVDLTIALQAEKVKSKDLFDEALRLKNLRIEEKNV